MLQIYAIRSRLDDQCIKVSLLFVCEAFIRMVSIRQATFEWADIGRPAIAYLNVIHKIDAQRRHVSIAQTERIGADIIGSIVHERAAGIGKCHMSEGRRKKRGTRQKKADKKLHYVFLRNSGTSGESYVA